MNSNKLSGSPKNGGYQEAGVGNSDVVSKDATVKKSLPTPGGEKSTGEIPGAGCAYTATLNERPNLSNPRNRGPERGPSVMGGTSIPVVSMADRQDGKVR